jgi:hypothetical protein
MRGRYPDAEPCADTETQPRSHEPNLYCHPDRSEGRMHSRSLLNGKTCSLLTLACEASPTTHPHLWDIDNSRGVDPVGKQNQG